MFNRGLHMYMTQNDAFEKILHFTVYYTLQCRQLARRWPSATFLLAPAPNQTFVQSNKDVYYVQGITISLINNFC